jgi:hypothetical protein
LAAVAAFWVGVGRGDWEFLSEYLFPVILSKKLQNIIDKQPFSG